MHELRRKRLAALEEASASRREAAMNVISIVFAGQEAKATFAEGPDGFICHRHADEDIDDFEARAAREVLAFKPPRMPPILVFLGNRNNPMNSAATA